MLLLYNVTDSCTLTFSEMFTKLPVCSDDSTHPCFSFNDETITFILNLYKFK